mgnify:FL=1
MIDRRTFLKLSAGALVLTAAGALTGCGQIEDTTLATVSVGDVVFTCALPFTSGGINRQITYRTEFTILNNSSETVKIAPEDIICIFRDTDGTEQTLKFKCKPLTAEPHQKAVYNGVLQFYLETENGVEEKYNTGTYELRVKYGQKIVVFFYNGKTVTGSVE